MTIIIRPIRPRPPFPVDPIPGPGSCARINAQLGHVSSEMAYVAALVNKRSGDVLLRRTSLLLDEVAYTLGAIALTWDGITPGWVPVLCQRAYASMRSLRLHAYRLVDVVVNRVDVVYVYGRVVSNGFTRNRPHDKLLFLRKYMQSVGYF